MDVAELIKLLGSGGVAVVAIVCLWTLARVMLRVGDRLIKAIDGLGQDIRDHTTKDLEHHADVRSAIDRLDGRLDGVLETTPIREQRAYEPRDPRERRTPRGVPISQYGQRRPTRNDEDK